MKEPKTTKSGCCPIITVHNKEALCVSLQFFCPIDEQPVEQRHSTRLQRLYLFTVLCER